MRRCAEPAENGSVLLLSLLTEPSKRPIFQARIIDEEHVAMAVLDWSQCPAVESVPGKVSGAWVFKDTRMPVATVFENLEAGLTVEEVMEEFAVTREQINAVLHFAANSLKASAPPSHELQAR